MMVKGYTSGTSGTPLVLYRNYTSILKENAYLWAHRISAGHQPGMKAVSLRGDLNATQMECFDPYTNTLYLSSFCLKEENMQWYYEKIARFQPNAIYAYPSSLEILCNILKAAGKYLPIKLVFTSSETLYDFQREKIREVLGAQIFDWYGNAERTIALQEGNRGLYHEPPLYAVNEYNAHDIYTSSLINEAFPLIRYRVDDVVDFVLTEDQQCIITGIQGRKDDFLEFTDGRIIGRMSGTLKGVNHIKYAQFVQDIPSEFRINIVPECAFSEDDKKDLESKVRSKVGDVPFTISIVDENKIIKTKAGKYKLIVNNFVRNKLINSV
jgi:phenylacetate-CoA ligase